MSPKQVGALTIGMPLLPRCPQCGSAEITCPFDPSHVCLDCDHAWREEAR